MSRTTKRLSGAGALAVLALAAVLAGCGGGNSTPIALKIGVSEQGKEASFSLPKSVEGGLVDLTLTNEGKAPHGLQFVRYTDGHTAKEVTRRNLRGKRKDAGLDSGRRGHRQRCGRPDGDRHPQPRSREVPDHRRRRNGRQTGDRRNDGHRRGRRRPARAPTALSPLKKPARTNMPGTSPASRQASSRLRSTAKATRPCT